MADEKQVTQADSEATGLVTIKAKAPKIGKEVEFKRDLGLNLKDAVKKYGEEVVFNYFQNEAITRCQNVVRNALMTGKTQEEAIKAGLEWKPGVVVRGTRTRKDPLDALLQKVAMGELSEEELRKLLDERLKQLSS